MEKFEAPKQLSKIDDKKNVTHGLINEGMEEREKYTDLSGYIKENKEIILPASEISDGNIAIKNIKNGDALLVDINEGVGDAFNLYYKDNEGNINYIKLILPNLNREIESFTGLQKAYVIDALEKVGFTFGINSRLESNIDRLATKYKEKLEAEKEEDQKKNLIYRLTKDCVCNQILVDSVFLSHLERIVQGLGIIGVCKIPLVLICYRDYE